MAFQVFGEDPLPSDLPGRQLPDNVVEGRKALIGDITYQDAEVWWRTLRYAELGDPPVGRLIEFN